MKVLYVVSGLLLGLVGVLAYRNHRLEQVPTWAEFKVVSDVRYYAPVANEDGVPNTLFISDQEWSVVKVKVFTQDPQHIEAQTYCHNRTIAYLDAGNSTVLRDNLWHEIFHAGACAHGGDTYWNSVDPSTNYHPGIYHLGQFMAVFSKANPQFMAWAVQ